MDSSTVAGVSTRVKDCATTWLRIDIIVIPVVIQSVQVALGVFERFGLRLTSSKQHCSANPIAYFCFCLASQKCEQRSTFGLYYLRIFVEIPVINQPANFRHFMSRFGRLIISVAGARNRGWDDWQGDEAPEELTPVQAPKRRWGKEEAGHQKGEGSSNNLSKITKHHETTKSYPQRSRNANRWKSWTTIENFWVHLLAISRFHTIFRGRYCLTILDLAVQF